VSYPPDRSPQPWYQEPGFLIAGLVVVVIVIVLIIAAVDGGGPATDATGTPTTEDETEQTEQEETEETEAGQTAEPEQTTEAAQTTRPEETTGDESPAAAPPSPTDQDVARGPEEGDAPESRSYSAQGSGTTEPIPHQGGLAVVSFDHRGDGEFSAAVRPADGGGSQELVSNRSDGYAGARALGLAEGRYTIDVEAAGSWNIRFEQPRYTDAVGLPVELRGRSDSATEPFRTEGGDVRFAWDPSNGSGFRLRLLSADGEVVFSQDANSQGSRAAPLDEGIYLVDVRADGPWRIEIS
jgi:hypothetical protein